MSTHTITQHAGRYLPISVEPKRDQEGNHRRARDGRPLWSVQVLFTPSVGAAEVIKVTVPAEACPTIIPMKPARFEDLKVGFYSMAGGASGLFFSADAVSMNGEEA